MRRPLLILAAVGTAAGVLLALRSRPAPVPAAPAAPRPAWVFEAPQPGSVIAAPCVTPDAVYLAVTHYRGRGRVGTVYALDPATGKTRWSHDADGGMLATASTPTVSGGRLYVGDGMHADFACRLHCLDAASGKALWSFPVGNHIEGEPVVDGDTVYFPAGNDGLYALDAARGHPSWNFRGDLHIDSRPCVAGGRVFVGSGLSRRFRDHQVVCLDARSGNPVWRTPVDLPAWGGPVVAGDRVFVGLGNGRLTESAHPPETPAGGLACLDRDSGKLVWVFRTGDAVFGRPLVVGDRVVFGSRDGNLYGVALDGTERFRVAMGGPVVASPTADVGLVLAVSVPGRVVCVDPADSREVWRLELGRPGAEPLVFSAPVVDNGRLYVAAEMTAGGVGIVSLFCFHLPSLVAKDP